MSVNDYYGGLTQKALEAARQHVIGVAECFTGPYYRGQDRSKWDNHFGGCFCLMDNATGKIILLAFIGDPAESKWDKYAKLAQEKAIRLFKHPKDQTSFDSRDDEKERYPGAVRGKQYIYSFSGFPAYGDTLTMACVAVEVETDGHGDPVEFLSAEDTIARNALITYVMYLNDSTNRATSH